MEIIYCPFGELPDNQYGLTVAGKIAEYESRLAAYCEGSIHYRVHETNHGRGADLLTITVSLVSFGGVAFFAIPTAHKKIREALEEWRRIKGEITALVSWISTDTPSLPIELLFLEAVTDLAQTGDVEDVEFLSAYEMPTDNGFDNLKTYLFVFRNGNELRMVAWDSQKSKRWSHGVKL